MDCFVKRQKGITITSAFQKVLDEHKHKPNKIMVDQGSELYNSSMKPWLHSNDFEMYSTYNEAKSVVAERFIRTMKNKICKHMIVVSKYVGINKFDEIVDKYYNIYHRKMKMKLVDVIY